MKFKKIISNVLCMALIVSNITVASASNVIISETSLEDESLITEEYISDEDNVDLNEEILDDGNNTDENENINTEEEDNENIMPLDDGVYETPNSVEEVKVTYIQVSDYSVSIPKTVTLGKTKEATYSIKVTGNIDTIQQVHVEPLDSVSNEEGINFYMKDTAGKKANVLATITPNKVYWSSEEVKNGYEATDNLISAPRLTSGSWEGVFQIQMSLEASDHEHNYENGICTECGGIDPSHEHNYVDGECTICGQKGHVHDYVNGKCECGELDPEHTHNYSETIITEATCTEFGQKELTCTCGDKKTETIPATGHEFGSDDHCTECGTLNPEHTHNYTETVTTPATCTENGEKELTCSCGDTKTETVPATGHEYGADDKCTECGELKPDHVHNYTETVTKPATCTETGTKTLTCTCGDVKTETIPVTGHEYGADDHCTECGVLNPSHKHDYSVKVLSVSDCTNTGEKQYTCSCGDTYKETTPANGHDFRQVDDKCEHCGILNPAHVHTYTERLTTAPTCTTAGQKKMICKCGDSYDEAVLATGHSYGANDKCTVCGILNPGHVHEYTERITKVATCTETGEKKLTCKCGDSYNETIPVGEHNYKENINIISWENTDNGTYAFEQAGTKWTSNNQYKSSSTATSTWTITVDEDTEYTLKYKVSSHTSYGKFTVKLDTTTIANNISGAGEELTYTTVLTEGPHTLTATYYKSSSTYQNEDIGYVILPNIKNGNHKCSICGDEKFHTYDSGTITKNATCTETGIKTYTCRICNGTKTEVIEALGHNYVNGVCTICKKDQYLLAPADAISKWNYSIDYINNKIILNYYTSNYDTDVIVYGNYEVDGKVYNTQIKSNFVDFNNIVNPTENYMFRNKSNIKSIIFSKDIDCSTLINTSYMFYGCNSLTQIDLSGLDTSNVTDMKRMFEDCSSLINLDLSTMNTSKVTNMFSMFSYSGFVHLDLSNFDTSNVTDMSWMFSNCKSLMDLNVNNWNTNKVEDMYQMFNNCSSLSILDVSHFNTDNVTSMSYMFSGCSSLTSLNLTNFNTKNSSRKMNYMFSGCNNLKVIYVTKENWVCDTDTNNKMFLSCGTSSVTYK